MQTLTKLSNNPTIKMGRIKEPCCKCGGNVFKEFVYDDNYNKTVEKNCMQCGANQESYGQLALRW